MSKSKSKTEVAYNYILDNYNQAEDFRFDVLSGKVQMRIVDHKTLRTMGFRDVTNRDYATIARECSVQSGINVSPQDIHFLLQSDMVSAVNPLRDYLDQLKPFPEDCPIDWIDQLANQVHVAGGPDKQRLWCNCFHRWFLVMVASWRWDDAINQHALILIGPQGIYKTSWLRSLMPPVLRPYMCDQPTSREMGKDERMRITEYALINLDEIEAATPREMNVLKSVITAADVSERAAYAITKERRIRVASFCGSGNNPRFLTDDTGNRRWLPFEVISIDSPYAHTQMYDMIYAQAICELDQGVPYHFEQDELRVLAHHTADYQAPRNEDDLLLVHFRPATPDDTEARFMTASEIHAILKVDGDIKRPMPLSKFGQLLNQCGFVPKTIHGRKGYSVVLHADIFDQQKQLARLALHTDTDQPDDHSSTGLCNDHSSTDLCDEGGSGW